MIEDFACEETENVWEGRHSRKLPSDIQNVARRKLRYLHYAKSLDDLRSRFGNKAVQRGRLFTPAEKKSAASSVDDNGTDTSEDAAE